MLKELNIGQFKYISKNFREVDKLRPNHWPRAGFENMAIEYTSRHTYYLQKYFCPFLNLLIDLQTTNQQPCSKLQGMVLILNAAIVIARNPERSRRGRSNLK